jgi:hypothetical protein
MWIDARDVADCATYADTVNRSDGSADSHRDTDTFGDSVAERERVAESD